MNILLHSEIIPHNDFSFIVAVCWLVYNVMLLECSSIMTNFQFLPILDQLQKADCTEY